MFPMLLLAASLAAPDAAACGRLQALSLPETTILSTEVVRSGTFTPPGTSAATPPAARFRCRRRAGWSGVSSRRLPSKCGCRIGLERQVPGGSATAGSPASSLRCDGIGARRGYATASTDTGQSAPDGSWASAIRNWSSTSPIGRSTR